MHSPFLPQNCYSFVSKSLATKHLIQHLEVSNTSGQAPPLEYVKCLPDFLISSSLSCPVFGVFFILPPSFSQKDSEKKLAQVSSPGLSGTSLVAGTSAV